MRTVSTVLATLLLLSALAGLTACSDKGEGGTELTRFPIESMSGIVDRRKVDFDNKISADGNGSVRLTVYRSTTYRLYETEEVDLENAQLIYRANLRTENFEGKAYLEMWCDFDGKGEYFSRDLASPVVGNSDWVREETPFLLKTGENPDRVRLNLVVEGKGTVWIDNIGLFTAPL